MRSKKAITNSTVSIIYEIVTMICGLILPRMILGRFGSSYNGITSSITQFLQCVTLLRAGVAGVTRASLYKPLAENDTRAISGIINATSLFMKRVALIFGTSIIAFACVYPFLVKYEFSWFFSFSLVLILGISTFAQYYFGITYQMLLQADQRQYVVAIIQIATTIANTIIAAVLINLGFGIHAVKLGSAIVFSMNPIAINIYVRKKYQIDSRIAPNMGAIKQRWDAFWQSVAIFVHSNTDVIVLTCFADIKEVSVYTVYNYVIANIQNIVRTFVSGFGAAFGNMLAKNEYELAKKNFRVYELVIFNLTSIIYTTAGVMIVPFVMVYTHGVTDVQYARPLYALIATVAGAFHCFRIPYQTVVEAAGHFKQTRNGAIVEAALNITISVVLVIKFGLIGVAIGTLVATVFRSVQYSTYLSRNILERSQLLFYYHIIINVFIAIATWYISNRFLVFPAGNYFQWAVRAAAVTMVATVLTLISDFVFYKEDSVYLIKKMKLKKRRG